ncbi:hypothetical protein Tsubulata_013334 [Turnera subulata]|uniref:CCHC-type domain-containing protein n=1 Tax=Turnera subulata TaxID=218843 RepID=A0A9Q0JI61_9ROSI|nr:hypothetical protein Tsubulata_013334 [Turnera subulata]
MEGQEASIDSLVEQAKGLQCHSMELTLKDDPMVNARVAQRMLVGKLICDEVLNRRAAKVTIRKSWRLGATMDIYDVEDNGFIFMFYDRADKQKILSQGPWTIMGAHLVLKDWSPDAVLDEIDFSCSPFWVHVRGLPVHKQTAENARIIGCSFGECLEVDLGGRKDVCFDSYFRVRVMMKVTEPLRSGFTWKRDGKPDAKVDFSYERLPDFCYGCGMFGHVLNRCSRRLEFKDARLQYSPSLRVEVMLSNMATFPPRNRGVMGSRNRGEDDSARDHRDVSQHEDDSGRQLANLEPRIPLVIREGAVPPSRVNLPFNIPSNSTSSGNINPPDTSHTAFDLNLPTHHSNLNYSTNISSNPTRLPTLTLTSLVPSQPDSSSHSIPQPDITALNQAQPSKRPYNPFIESPPEFVSFLKQFQPKKRRLGPLQPEDFVYEQRPGAWNFIEDFIYKIPEEPAGPVLEIAKPADLLTFQIGTSRPKRVKVRRSTSLRIEEVNRAPVHESGGGSSAAHSMVHDDLSTCEDEAAVYTFAAQVAGPKQPPPQQ